MALSMLAATPAFTGPMMAPALRAAAVQSSSVTMKESVWQSKKAIPFLKVPPKLDGSMAGDLGFDPLQISDLVPLQWSREAELKHARVCMLAVAGWVSVDLGFRVPYAPEVSSLYAHDAAVEKGPMLFLFMVLTVVELIAGVPKAFQIMNDPDAAPGGDYKFDPLGFSDEKNIKMMQEKEIANGRLAMLAFSGIVTQSALTGNTFPYTWNGAADLVPPLAMTTLPGICASGLANGCQ